MGSFRMQVGNAEIVAFSDMNFVMTNTLQDVWPEVPLDAWKPYIERYPDTFEGAHMRLEVGCYLVRSQGRTILIDTGFGAGPIEHIGGRRGELMADLASKKVSNEDVDVVFLSHLHLDHVGWNTTLREDKWVPTFPNARYVCHEADLEHFRKPEVQAAQHYRFIHMFVEPLDEQGLLDTVSGDVNLADEVKGVHTPGHTPGHMSVLVTSGGERVNIQGDVLIQPAQVTEEDWNSRYDVDWDTATATRRKLLDQVESDGITVISCHFPLPGFGRVVRSQGRRYWQSGL